MTRISQQIERADLLSVVEHIYELADRWELSGEGQVLCRFNKREINILLALLGNLKVLGSNHTFAGGPFGCDICDAEFAQAGYFIDGAIGPHGAWVTMCRTCFEGGGGAIGWGKAQLYAQRQDGWQCIGGGDPDPIGGWE